MRISPQDLLTEARRALAAWPYLPQLERTFGLPLYLLLAVGSRETNLTNEVGDGGHGHGVWQLDNRSHVIPPGFDHDVHRQAVTAATMLRAGLREYHHLGHVRELHATLAAYNAGGGTVAYNLTHGLDLDTGTALGDYGADTYERLTFLRDNLGPATPPPAHERVLSDHEVAVLLTDFGAALRGLTR